MLDAVQIQVIVTYTVCLNVLWVNSCDNPIANCHRLLDLTGPLQLGGLPWAPSTGQVTQQDFVGCISHVYIDDQLLDLNSSVVSVQTSVGCPQKKTHCQSSPCTLGGQYMCVSVFVCEFV